MFKDYKELKEDGRASMVFNDDTSKWELHKLFYDPVTGDIQSPTVSELGSGVLDGFKKARDEYQAKVDDLTELITDVEKEWALKKIGE